MLNPSTLVDSIVAKLQSIPEVVTELGELATNIQSYESEYPSSLTITEAVHNQPNPSIIVVWNGSGPGESKRGDAWVHRLSLLCKTQNKYADLFTVISNGIPGASTDDGLNFRRTSIHTSCDPISTLTADRRQLFVNDYSAIDYLEISFTLIERGIGA